VTWGIGLHGIAKLYGRTAALKAVSLHLDAGQILLLLGPNGSGKTTLLKIVAGAIAPTIGTGSVFGLDIIAQRRELRSHIGLLAGESYLYEDLTALENLRFMTTMAGLRPDQGEILRALDRVALLPHADHRVRDFSSGMKCRLAVARLLLLHPQLLLLDEPYNSLDAAGADLVDAVIREAVREGRTVALATHDAERGLALADSVACLDRGVLTYFESVHTYRMENARTSTASGSYSLG